MKLKKSYLSVLISALLIGGGVTACSSGDNSSEPTGAVKTRSGVITGFGSVFVNGVEYETDNATITIDGQQGSEDDLDIGMVVTLSGSVNDDGASGMALSIDYDDEVEGSISAINLSGGVSSIDVLGQTVNIDADTLFESDDAGITAIDMLQVGNVVEISGYSSGAGEIFATRIEVKSAAHTDGDEMEVKGLVTNLDTVAMTFSIGDLAIDYSDAITEDFPASGISDGQLVEAKTTSAIVDNTLFATKLELESEDGKSMDGDEGEEVEIEGVVTAELVDNRFMINDQVVIIDNASTEFEHGSVDNIVSGVKLEVEGMLDAEGNLVASEIEFREQAETEIQGPIDAVSVENNSITVLGLEIQADTLTRMKDERDDNEMTPVRYFSLADLSIGDWVDVEFYENDSGERVATEMERDDMPENGMVKLEGDISEVTETGLLIVSGISIDVSISTDTFSVSDEIEVEGTFADGVLTATAVSMDD